MPEEPQSLLERISLRPLPSVIPQDRDVNFSHYASDLPTPPLYFLTPAAVSVATHPGYKSPFVWSIPEHDMLHVFMSLTFALARLDHPDSTLIFLFYIWADNETQALLARDPRFHRANWGTFCDIIRDAFPALGRTPPVVTMDLLVLFDSLIQRPNIATFNKRRITRRFALLFNISAQTDFLPVIQPPSSGEHPHQGSSVPLLRGGPTLVESVSNHAASLTAITFNLIVRLTNLASHPANVTLAGQYPGILDHIILLADYLGRLREDVRLLDGLFLLTYDFQLQPATIDDFIDLTQMD